MPWFKVDDGFTESRKVKAIPRKDRFQALGLWLTAGNFAAKELTDGHIPTYYLEDIFAPEELIEILISVGLWDRDAEGEIWFHDWCEYQPSATAYREKQEKLKAKRSEDGKVAAAKRWHKEPNAAPIGLPIESAKVQNAPEPEPEPEPFTSNEVNTYGDLAFDEFWSFYPRKIGKGGAKKTWQKITRRVKPEVIVEGARRMASDPNLPETQFIPHPSTWLNEGRWDDEPYAPRGKANLKQIQQREASEKFLASFTEQPAITANPEWA